MMNERREAIVRLVNNQGSATITQLKDAFPEVSEMTIRNDIKALDAEHRLVRIYGGVRSIETAVGADGLIDLRRSRNVAAKGAIARKAAGLIAANTHVYLDSGSTVAALAASLPDVQLQVFTCGIYNVLELGKYSYIKTIVPGRALNRFNMCLHGSRAVREVSRMHFDQVFIGASGYTPDSGFTCGSDEEAELKRVAIARADTRIMLLDSSKVDRTSTFTFCDISDLDVIVTEGDLPDELKMRCEKAGVRIL